MDIILSNRDLSLVKDVVMANLNVSAVASRVATHYHSRDEQTAAVRDAVEKARSVSREIPLLIASVAGARGHYIQEAIIGELSLGRRGRNRIISMVDWDDNRFSDAVLMACMRNLDENAGTPYVLRMFSELAARGVNNGRTRRYIMSYIFDRDPGSLEFMAVKYRTKLRRALRHVWGKRMTGAMVKIVGKMLWAPDEFEYGVSDEKSREIEQSLLVRYLGASVPIMFAERIVEFIFGVYDNETYYTADDFPVINQFFRARTDITNCDKVPEEVLVGLLSDKNHPQYGTHWSTEAQQTSTLEMIRNRTKVETANQAVRKTKQERDRGIERQETRVAQATDPIALLKTIFEGGRSDEIDARLSELAKKARYRDFPYAHIGVILDRSRSMEGHWQESKNTPRAMAQFTAMVLTESAETDLAMTSRGDVSDISTAFLELMSHDEDGNPADIQAIFILSDGYENSYEGMFGEVVAAYRANVRDVPIYHVSPVGVAEENARARALPGAVSVAATYKTLPTQVAAHLLEADLRGWLESRVRALEASNGSNRRD